MRRSQGGQTRKGVGVEGLVSVSVGHADPDRPRRAAPDSNLPVPRCSAKAELDCRSSSTRFNTYIYR